MTIRTNHHWRPFASRSEVPADILESQFDYQPEDISDTYFRYLNTWYHLDQFMRCADPANPLQDWHGYCAEGFTDGVLVRISDDGESYQVARYHS